MPYKPDSLSKKRTWFSKDDGKGESSSEEDDSDMEVGDEEDGGLVQELHELVEVLRTLNATLSTKSLTATTGHPKSSLKTDTPGASSMTSHKEPTLTKGSVAKS